MLAVILARHERVAEKERGLRPAKALIMWKMKHELLARAIYLANATVLEYRYNAATLDVLGQILYTRPLRVGGKQIEAHHANVGKRIRFDSRPANDERRADPPLGYSAFSARYRRPGGTVGAVVPHVDQVGVIAQPEAVEPIHDDADSHVEIFRDSGALDVVVDSAGLSILVVGNPIRRSILGIVQWVVGDMHKERFARITRLCHEVERAVGHTDDIAGVVGLVERRGITVGGIAVVFVVAVISRSSPAQMPLAVVRRGVARVLQQLADRHFFRGEVAIRIRRRNQPGIVCRGEDRRSLRPLILCRALAGLQACPCRRADGRRRVCRRKPHSLRREFLQARRAVKVALRVRHLRVHLDGEPVPGLVVRKHEDDIGPLLPTSDLRQRTQNERRREPSHNVTCHAIPLIYPETGSCCGCHNRWRTSAYAARSTGSSCS